ncbi:ORF3 protein [Bat coronavirus 1B]|uniref:ORF3 protein n=3 Tax=Orthocoronavirinae TaxID=2501931 RepID=B1PHI9_9ALPC|nr:ORF3 protein [Bat coronavirus 1B]WCC62000.1 ORF3 protein [Bat Coronavirus MpGD16]WCC62012.1 ORF3 protein [Bat Coronavirus MpHI19]
MWGGLFQLQFEKALISINSDLKLPEEHLKVVESHLAPIHYATSSLGYLFTSFFVVYFALFKANTYRSNFVCFIFRLALILLYSPLLLYYGSFIDGSFIAIVLIGRICQTLYFAFRHKDPSFVILNTCTLATIDGKSWYYYKQKPFVLHGGRNHVKFGPYTIIFISNNSLFVNVRGYTNLNLEVIRVAELPNDSLFYIFGTEPVNDVKVVDMLSSTTRRC